MDLKDEPEMEKDLRRFLQKVQMYFINKQYKNALDMFSFTNPNPKDQEIFFSSFIFI